MRPNIEQSEGMELLASIANYNCVCVLCVCDLCMCIRMYTLTCLKSPQKLHVFVYKCAYLKYVQQAFKNLNESAFN